LLIVTLHGSAGREEERRAIEEAVRRVPGPRDVINRTRVAG
jgi:osmotically-inducible protein OsmY